jgi:hypothetical protein
MRLRGRKFGGGGSELLDWGGTERYTMEILRPKSSGLDSNDRIYAAYPGLTYTIGAAVIGGVPPFKYELTANVPSGMSINANTGVITWTNPQAGTYTDVTMRVTDTKGTQVTSTWTPVCATTRFRFFDAVNGNNSWDGTSPTFVSGTTGPKQTLAAWHTIGSSTLIGYFRTGTYTNAGITVQSDGIRWTVVNNRPSIFLAYPGESPLFDFEHNEGVVEAEQWDFGEGGNTPRMYLDGLEFTRSGNKALRIWGCDNVVIRNCYFHDFGPGADGSNSAAIDWESGGYASGVWDNNVIQDCEFSDITPPTVGTEPNSAFKLYATNKMLIERCYFHDMTIDGEDEEVIANKAGNDRLTVRGCWSENMGMGSYGGNQDPQATGECGNVELQFNHFTTTSSTVTVARFNHDGETTTPHYIARNTFEGKVHINTLATGEGPYVFLNNVIINGNAATDVPDGSGITHNIGQPADASEVTIANHLFGAAADGIVDANGLLQGSYRTNYLYYRGHEAPTL